VREALVLLKFAGVRGAQPIERLLRSAISNAETNHGMNSDELYVTKITVDGGPGGRFTKRLDPRAQGRAYFKRKRLSHVTVIVGEEPPKHVRRGRPGAAVKVTRQQRRAPASARPRKRTAKAAKAGAQGES
jgi:large subunit ribosomal protein L22